MQRAQNNNNDDNNNSSTSGYIPINKIIYATSYIVKIMEITNGMYIRKS